MQVFDKKSFLESGALFGKKNRLFLLWGQRKRSTRIPSTPAVCKRGFFDEAPLVWQSFEKGIEINRNEARDIFETRLKQWHWDPPRFEDFKKQFLFLKEAFIEKGLKKAVPYVFEISREGVWAQDLESMIACGLRQDEGFFFGEWSHGQGLIGLTPEILFSKKSQKKFETMALASTLTCEEFERDPDKLLKDDKQIQEHEWVVEDIKNQLSLFADFKLGKRIVKKTSTLFHLFTPIEFEIKDPLSIDEWVFRLHPTAALGCHPRNLWKIIMGQLDQWNPRGFFGTPFGFSFHSKVDFVVAIRSLFWSGQNLKLGAGCGVTPLSDLENEWKELENKRKSVKGIFGL